MHLLRRRYFGQLAALGVDLGDNVKIVKAKPLDLAFNLLPLGEFEKEGFTPLQLGDHLIVGQKTIKTLYSHEPYSKPISFCAQGTSDSSPLTGKLTSTPPITLARRDVEIVADPLKTLDEPSRIELGFPPENRVPSRGGCAGQRQHHHPSRAAGLRTRRTRLTTTTHKRQIIGETNRE